MIANQIRRPWSAGAPHQKTDNCGRTWAQIAQHKKKRKAQKHARRINRRN